MSDDNVIRPVNWEILRELNTAPKDEKHFVGTQRCMACGHEHQAMTRAPLWAGSPATGECPECGAIACLYVDDEDFAQVRP